MTAEPLAPPHPVPAGGKTDADIAARLSISPRTVHKHLEHIYAKLGVETRTAAVMRALAARSPDGRSGPGASASFRSPRANPHRVRRQVVRATNTPSPDLHAPP
jgi:hypothetical protein